MEQIAAFLGTEAPLLKKLLGSIIVVVGLFLVRTAIFRRIRKQTEDHDSQYRARKVTTYAMTITAVITLALIWIDAFTSVGTYLGLVSAGIAIALSDLLKNMAGWGYILVRRPFRVGDRIEIQDLRGDVIDIRLFRFTVMEVGKWVDADQSTGRLVHVPNGLLFTNQVANYTEGFAQIWDEIPILISFESDHERAEALIRQVLVEKAPDLEADARAKVRETARVYHIKIGALTPTVYLSVRDSGVLLTARYLVDVRKRRGVQSDIWRAILEAFHNEPTISLAYPTVRTYLEGPIHVAEPTVE